MTAQQWYVYMVQCADNSLYTGITTDTERRLHEHNNDNKKGARYTKVRRPVVMVYQEARASRADACKREAAIKKLNRKQKLNMITVA